MTRHIIGRVAFSGALVLALGFGARAAAAEPAEVGAPAWVCTQPYDCREYCRRNYGWEYTPKCYNNQCACVLI